MGQFFVFASSWSSGFCFHFSLWPFNVTSMHVVGWPFCDLSQHVVPEVGLSRVQKVLLFLWWQVLEPTSNNVIQTDPLPTCDLPVVLVKSLLPDECLLIFFLLKIEDALSFSLMLGDRLPFTIVYLKDKTVGVSRTYTPKPLLLDVGPAQLSLSSPPSHLAQTKYDCIDFKCFFDFTRLQAIVCLWGFCCFLASYKERTKNTKNTGALDLHDCPTRHLERWWEIITWSNVLCNVLADFWQRLFCSSESSHLDAGIIIGFLKQYKKPQELCVAIVLNPKCHKQPWNISPLKV